MLQVTMPNSGSSFFNNNDLVDPFKNGMGSRISGVADAVQFDNAAYVTKHGRSVSVAVLPNSGSVDAQTLAAFARIVARRLP